MSHVKKRTLASVLSILCLAALLYFGISLIHGVGHRGVPGYPSMLAAGTSLVVEAAAPLTSISVNDGHPVWEIARQLQERYGYAITYEDPRYTNDDDHEDVTLQVRKDLQKYPSGEAPQVIGMKVRGLTLAVPDTSNISPQEMAKLLEQLVEAQDGQGTGGHFRVLQTGNQFHIVPTAVRDRNGTWIEQNSILDTPISLTLRGRTSGEILAAVCEAVDAAAHVKIAIVTNFGGGIGAHVATYALSADQEPARTVLMRALALDSPNASWVITYNKANEYFLMLTGYPLKAVAMPATSTAPQRPQQPYIGPASVSH